MSHSLLNINTELKSRQNPNGGDHMIYTCKFNNLSFEIVCMYDNGKLHARVKTLKYVFYTPRGPQCLQTTCRQNE